MGSFHFKRKTAPSNQPELLERLRTLIGDNPSELARKLRIPELNLKRYCDGSSAPDYELYRRIYGAGLDLHWLQTGIKEERTRAPITAEIWWQQCNDKRYLRDEQRVMDRFLKTTNELSRDELDFFLTCRETRQQGSGPFLVVRLTKTKDGRVNYYAMPVIVTHRDNEPEAVQLIQHPESEGIYEQNHFLVMFGLNGRKALLWYEIECGGAIGMNCPYCRSAFTKEDAIVSCAKCLTVHHQVCWDEAGHCCSFGCHHKLRFART